MMDIRSIFFIHFLCRNPCIGFDKIAHITHASTESPSLPRIRAKMAATPVDPPVEPAASTAASGDFLLDSDRIFDIISGSSSDF